MWVCVFFAFVFRLIFLLSAFVFRVPIQPAKKNTHKSPGYFYSFKNKMRTNEMTDKTQAEVGSRWVVCHRKHGINGDHRAEETREGANGTDQEHRMATQTVQRMYRRWSIRGQSEWMMLSNAFCSVFSIYTDVALICRRIDAGHLPLRSLNTSAVKVSSFRIWSIRKCVFFSPHFSCELKSIYTNLFSSSM